MDAPRRAPSSADVTTEVNGLLVGVGILTMALFPIALPGLLLALLLALPVAPLLLLAVVGYLLARILAVPVRLARQAWPLATGEERPRIGPRSARARALP